MTDKREDFLPLARPSLGQEEYEEVRQVLQSGWLTTGPKVSEFEQAVTEYLGCRAAVGLCSCTGGLHTALHALGVGPGDEVIVPTLTFAATAQVVHWLGAKPVLVDVDPAHQLLTPQAVEAAITPRTKGVIPVHLAGRVCDMAGLNRLCAERGLWVVEDAAHVMGAPYPDGGLVGQSRNAVVFSFYATKNMTTGEGGMAVSDDEELIEKIRRQSYFGIDKQAHQRYTSKGTWYYEIAENGFKYNMDSIQAALGLVQLRRLAEFNARRRRLAGLYQELLQDVPGVIPPPSPLEESTWHLFVARLQGGDGRPGRDRVIEDLRDWNIGAGVHYIPLHLHPFYAQTFGYKPGDFPQAEAYYAQALTLPLFPAMSDQDVAYVCEALREILA